MKHPESGGEVGAWPAWPPSHFWDWTSSGAGSSGDAVTAKRPKRLALAALRAWSVRGRGRRRLGRKGGDQLPNEGRPTLFGGEMMDGDRGFLMFSHWFSSLKKEGGRKRV